MLKPFRKTENTKRIWYNGGLMEDVFMRDHQGYYQPQFTSPEAELAFIAGAPALKPKGLSGALSYHPGKNELYLWWRRVVPKHSSFKGEKLPKCDGGNLGVFRSQGQTVRVVYDLIDPRSGPDEHQKVYRSMYQVIKAHREELLTELLDHDCFVTLEWLHSAFPFEEEPCFALHHDLHTAVVMETPFFDEMSVFFSRCLPVHGLVYRHERKLFKVEANGFCEVPQNACHTIIPYSLTPFPCPYYSTVKTRNQKKIRDPWCYR